MLRDRAACSLPDDTPDFVWDILHCYDDQASADIASGLGGRSWDARAWEDLEREAPEWAEKIRQHRHNVRVNDTLPAFGIYERVRFDGARMAGAFEGWIHDPARIARINGVIRKPSGDEYLLDGGAWTTAEHLRRPV